MATVTALKNEEIQSRLKDLPKWQLKNGALERVEKFPEYMDALNFVYKVGEAAEANDHHPDININYTTVTVRYSTHSVKGISELDFKMAGLVEKIIKQGPLSA